MATAKKGVRLFTPNDAQTWYQPEGRRIFLGDVLDETNSDTLGLGFARYAPGQSNEWVVTYDEALIKPRVSTASPPKTAPRRPRR